MESKIIIAIAVAAVVVVGVVAAAVVLMSGGEGGSVKYITLAPKDMKANLASGQIDAYIAWEPFVSDSVVGDVGEVLMWSDEIMDDHPCCVVAVRTGFLSETSVNGTDLTNRFVRAHVDATEWMLDALADEAGANYTKLVEMAVQFTARNESVVKAAFVHIQFGYEMGSDFEEALKKFTDMYIDTNMTTEEKLDERGYESVSDFVSSYVDDFYLATAPNVAESATILNPDRPIKLGYLLGDLHQLAQFVAQDKTVLGTDKSMFEKYGLKVEAAVGAPFANGGAEMGGFAAGNVDIGYLGAPPTILQHLNAGIGTKIVAQANSEGSGLVVSAGSGITSLSDLENKTVATPGESSIQFLLLKIALEREGLDLEIKT
ncbi:MAG: hypothetical protein A3K76_06420 [Euryarchaeota archaeon RBG_13_57_23]|nr:MAG: hypothetical protein A3K76_06420 [Euryarchaeota archaeon RBG_13_57_23]